MAQLRITMFSPKMQDRCAAIELGRHQEVIHDEEFGDVQTTPVFAWRPGDFLIAGERGSRIDVVRRGTSVLAYIVWAETKDRIEVQRVGVEPSLPNNEQRELIDMLVRERPEKMRGAAKKIVAILPESDLLVLNAFKGLGYTAKKVEKAHFGSRYVGSSVVVDGIKLVKEFKTSIPKVSYTDLALSEL